MNIFIIFFMVEAPHDSILSPLLFNVFLNCIFVITNSNFFKNFF